MISRVRIAAAATATGALLVPLTLLAGPGFAQGSPSAAQYKGKVTICHHAGKHGKTRTITVSSNALKAHLKHGDTLGACPTPPAKVKHAAADDGDKGDRKKNGKRARGQGK